MKYKKFENAGDLCSWVNKNRVKVVAISADGNTCYGHHLFYVPK